MAKNPTLLDMPLVRDGNKNVIPITDDGTTGLFSQQYGWQAINSLPLNAGGKAVMRQDYNGVFNLLSGVIFYAQKGFTFNYDNKQAYYKGCVVVDPTNNIKYECKADTQGNGYPSTDTSHWQVFKETYTLPTASSTTKGGVKIGSGITISSDGTISTKTYNNVTTSVAGLMSASDKAKLDGIEARANRYILPTASSAVLGGVKIGSGIFISNGVISTRIYTPATTSQEGLMSASDKAKLNGLSAIPVGTVHAFAGNTAPSGYLLCNGAAVSRATYSALFSVIGTLYGAGNGSTTFNLPNLVDRFIEGGSSSGAVKSAGLPNVIGYLRSRSNAFYGGGPTPSQILGYDSTSGVFSVAEKRLRSEGNADSNGTEYIAKFDASTVNAIYGRSTTVQPPALTMRYVIKY